MLLLENDNIEKGGGNKPRKEARIEKQIYSSLNIKLLRTLMHYCNTT